MAESDKNKTKTLSKEPHSKEDFIEIRAKIPTVEELFKAGAHFGHKTSKWNPKMEPFIFSVHNNIHIIDLEKTLESLKAAVEFVKGMAEQGGKILFVGTKPSAREIIEQVAKTCQMPYVSERWLGGTLTNYKTIKKRLGYLKELKEKKESSQFRKYTKKERLMKEREIAKLQKQFGGLIDMADLPKALFVSDIKDNDLAVREADKTGIPVVGISDTNSDPGSIKYPIVANDDAITSLKLIVGTIAGGIKEGQAKQKSKIKDQKSK